MLYYSCVDVLGIAIDFSSLTFHCIFSVYGVRSVMPYYNKMMMMMIYTHGFISGYIYG